MLRNWHPRIFFTFAITITAGTFSPTAMHTANHAAHDLYGGYFLHIILNRDMVGFSAVPPGYHKGITHI